MNTLFRTTSLDRASDASPASRAWPERPPASAVDWSGYFRGGPAATDRVTAESRQCYGLGGPGLKYRLGNECDFYGEFQLAQAMKADGVDFNAVLMTNYYSPATESDQSTNPADNYGIEQAYVEMKGIDFAPQVLFWMGKRRDRLDVHIVDTFFTNMSGVGAGFNNVDTGFGKFGLSAYKSDSVNGVRRRPAHRHDQRHQRPGGRLHAELLRHRPSIRTASCAWSAELLARATRKAG